MDDPWTLDLQGDEGDDVIAWVDMPVVKQHLLRDRAEVRSFRDVLVESVTECLSLWEEEPRPRARAHAQRKTTRRPS